MALYSYGQVRQIVDGICGPVPKPVARPRQTSLMSASLPSTTMYPGWRRPLYRLFVGIADGVFFICMCRDAGASF